MRRRQLLRIGGCGLSVVLAGCGGSDYESESGPTPTETPEPTPSDHLESFVDDIDGREVVAYRAETNRVVVEYKTKARGLVCRQR